MSIAAPRRPGLLSSLVNRDVDPGRAHFEITARSVPAARLARGPDAYAIQYLVDDAELQELVDREVRDLVLDGNESDPWSYLRHHQRSSAHVMGDVHFSWKQGTATPPAELVERAFEELVDLHAVRVESDSMFQRRARLMQSLWRNSKGLPPGLHRGRLLGSRLTPDAAETRANFVTPEIGRLVADEVEAAKKPGSGRLIATPRIFENLLSSQPLCFNLFGPLALDPGELGTRVFQREDEDGTRDRSAFDVFVEFDAATGGRGFIGIEVKYHEALGDAPAALRDSYDRIAASMGAFLDPAAPALRKAPLQQIWRDHLLAGALLQDRYETGFFLFLAPRDNDACGAAISTYEDHLANARTFASLHLEDVARTIAECGAGPWIDEVWARYFDFGRIERLVEERAAQATAPEG